ncbi:MAG: choice-of-anchor tandem repeat GloVer-containing protein [Terriglobales bacterium]
MNSPATNSTKKICLKISDVAPRFGATKLAAAAIRGALTLALLVALLLIAGLPAPAQTESVLYNFTGLNDGSNPNPGLTPDGAGNYHGTTLSGGTGDGGYGAGTVFELSPNGNGGWKETVLYNFCSAPSCADGGQPYAGVIFYRAGNLYGTTNYGGTSGCIITGGCGVVFEMSPPGASWTETVLYNFCTQGTGGSCPLGNIPVGRLAMDSAGNLYGADADGIFELSPSDGGWTLQLIYVVPGSSGVIMDAAGNLFGVGVSGYTGKEIAFELSPNGQGGWNSAVIYTFTTGPTGSAIWSGLALDQAGSLYGTESAYYNIHKKPLNFRGTVYKLSPGESGWTMATLFTFTPDESQTEGNVPVGVTLDAAGNIYGTTSQGGTDGLGTLYELVPVGKGKYQQRVQWNFNGTDGSGPNGGLVLDSAGNLYGTTPAGGSNGAGVVFEVTPLPILMTTTTLTSSPNPSTSGEAVTFTAVVSSSAGAPPNGETVPFMKGTTVLGTGTLSGGSASFVISTLDVGTTSVTAVYPGDFGFIGSKSNTVKQVVEKAAP